LSASRLRLSSATANLPVLREEGLTGLSLSGSRFWYITFLQKDSMHYTVECQEEICFRRATSPPIRGAAAHSKRSRRSVSRYFLDAEFPGPEVDSQVAHEHTKVRSNVERRTAPFSGAPARRTFVLFRIEFLRAGEPNAPKSGAAGLA
jgi:hypothetical protein